MRTHNMGQFYDLWTKRGDVPLLTVSNHNSCFDDPGIWGAIPFSEMRHRWLKWRWAPCAAELCFTSPFHVKMFSLGRCVPICRGQGVYQQAVDYCLERLNVNEWVHFYPEGRVVVEGEGNVRWKWGIGRLMAEASQMPIVLPIVHVGMDKVLPNKSPYILRKGQKVTLLYGEPITGLAQLRDELRAQNASPREIRKALCDVVQNETYKLQERANALHAQWLAE